MMHERPRVVCFLVGDTFAQAWHSRVFWIMPAATLCGVAWCLGADVAGPDGVRGLQAQLAGWGADGIGLILALMCTAGLLPAFLQPDAACMLLAKPVPRWLLLAGKMLGVLAFVALQDAVFFLTTWLALALRTGVWDTAYLACLPLVILHFGVFFTFSALLAVGTRSTVACLFGSVLFWLLCWGMNLGRHLVMSRGLEGMSPAFRPVVEFSYWVLPKPLDFHLLLLKSLQDENVFARAADLHTLAAHSAWSPAISLAASALFGLVFLVLSGYEFVTADY
jgi:hypothetical protein